MWTVDGQKKIICKYKENESATDWITIWYKMHVVILK